MAALLQCIFAFKQLEGLQVKMTELGKEALPLKELAARLLSYNEEVNASCKQEYLLINQSETDWTGLLAGLSLGQDKYGDLRLSALNGSSRASAFLLLRSSFSPAALQLFSCCAPNTLRLGLLVQLF